MAPQQRQTRRRRLAFVAATVAATAALASGPGFAAGTGAARAADPPAPTPAVTPVPVPPAVPPQPTTPAVPEPEKPRADVPAFGAYLDYGARGVARISELSQWLGGAELRVGHTYLPGDRWSNIEGAPGFLDVWADWRTEKDDRMLVLNVPMMERNEENVSDAQVRMLLRRAAAGEFDHHFRALGERLVELKVPDTVIVLGWEMNGITYTHRCGPDPESWKTYWNRIVTTMRAVPGQKFKFDFTPTRGRDAIPWTQCYPGDDTVDIIGMDSYDQPTGLSFDEQIKEPYGLQEHVDFAKAHKKPISYPEWGLFRNGDNAEYMRRMLAWMDEHKPLYNTLTDYCPHGVWQCGKNPKASEVYRSVLFGRTDPDPAPTEPTGPTTPTDPPKPTTPPACSPLDLGDWVEYWLGGKLCLRFDWFSRNR
ncbi:glycoside hydrolase family 26 protein [Streptomyces sp. YU58]|uniref:glycoside hydrolase family 26 protein n=1 Tax=Streptomyces sp. SX92 TaxID=3158972 RepID=UPI0027B8DEF8|nr:glycosyl hydrolase [Streptomyces coralus]WLW54882.1 glycosyl hydrolase [Streptomyces coralus]